MTFGARRACHAIGLDTSRGRKILPSGLSPTLESLESLPEFETISMLRRMRPPFPLGGMSGYGMWNDRARTDTVTFDRRAAAIARTAPRSERPP